MKCKQEKPSLQLIAAIRVVGIQVMAKIYQIS